MRDLIRALDGLISADFSALREAKGDLKKQAVVLMGLPAAGKSTFVDNELSRYITNVSAPKVENSDAQVKRTQREYADRAYRLLSKAKGEVGYKRRLKLVSYTDNSRKRRHIALSLDEFRKLKSAGELFRKEYKNFFVGYFDMRELAKARTGSLFRDKVKSSGDGFVIDTVASVPSKIFAKLKRTREQGFNNSVFYLEIDPELTIIRDRYRGETEGRTVGADVITNYASQMSGAFAAYKADVKSKDGVIDRLYHFRWAQRGDDPIKGKWNLLWKYRGDVKREVDERKRQKAAAN